MPIRSSYPNGIPAWVDIASRDAETAKRFYGDLFGWEWIPEPLAGGDTYWLGYLDSQPIVGLTGMTPGMVESGMASRWFRYIAVDDVDASLAIAVLSGGTIMAPAMDVGGKARMAFVLDPVGASIGLWHSEEIPGSGLIFETGVPVWQELHAVDLDAVKRFYGEVFDWTPTATSRPDGSDVIMFSVGDEPVAGLATPSTAEVATDWHVYFYVDDVDATASAVMSNGGRVAAAPDGDSGGMHAAFIDPTGAAFSVYSSPTEDAE